MKYAVLAICLLLAACGGNSGLKPGYDPNYDAQAPKTTENSSYRTTGIEHYLGKAKFFYFGLSQPSPAAIAAAEKGMERTWSVLEKEYPANAAKLVKYDQYAVVFWKPSPLCTSAPAFTVTYWAVVVLNADGTAKPDEYDQGDYDKDPRKGRVTICAAGKSSLHTWNQGKPDKGIPDSVHRIDLVDDPAMTEGAARHEALHLGLWVLDPARYQATIYHGGDWETILGKVENSPAPLVGGRTKYARIQGIIDGEGEQQDFGIIAVK